jgi:hypothetical protein
LYYRREVVVHILSPSSRIVRSCFCSGVCLLNFDIILKDIASCLGIQAVSFRNELA